MADRLSTISNPNGTLRFIETAANATRNAGILGSSYIIKYVKLDNSLNTTEAVYLKIWFDGTPPTVGTTTPDMIFKAPAGGVVEYLIPSEQLECGDQCCSCDDWGHRRDDESDGYRELRHHWSVILTVIGGSGGHRGCIASWRICDASRCGRAD